jgi:hypothetical protein
VSCEQHRLTLARARLREILPPSDQLLCLLAGEWNQLKRQSRSAPSPLVGEGWGGGSLLLRERPPPTATPTPNPSPQGGGERTECAATVLRRAPRDML